MTRAKALALTALLAAATCLPPLALAETIPPPEPAGGLEAPRGRSYVPHEVPDDPYVAVPRTIRRTAPAQLWTRNGHVSVQVNVDAVGNNILGDAANEPSIAVDPTDPDRMAIGWRQFDTTASNFRQAGWAHSSDGGTTWTFPGVLEPGVFRSDPVLDADNDGTFYYNSLTVSSGYTCDVSASTDGGSTWGSPTYAYGGDKAWMAVNRNGAGGDGFVFTAWSVWAGCCGSDTFNRSTDGSQSFATPMPMPEDPVWGVVTVAPDGAVYVAGSRAGGAGFAVARSTNASGIIVPVSFDFATVVNLGGEQQAFVFDSPNPDGLLGQVWIAADHSDRPSRGNIYLLCSVDPPDSDPLDVSFARSTDGGVSWSAPERVNDDPPQSGAWQWFGTMSVAANGRIDVVWNDSRADPGGYDSELYYAFSVDAGRSWSTGVPISPSFDPYLGWPQQAKLGDYYDMVSDESGASLAYAATFNGEQDVYFVRIPSPVVFADGFESGDSGRWTMAGGR